MIAQVFILSLGLGLCAGWLIGNYREYNNASAHIARIEDELQAAYGELDELREIIYWRFGSSIRRLDSDNKPWNN